MRIINSFYYPWNVHGRSSLDGFHQKLAKLNMTDFDGGLIIQVYDFHTGQERVSSV